MDDILNKDDNDYQRKNSRKGIPVSNKNKVIIPSNSFTFDKKSFREEYLKNYLIKEDFEGIVEEVNKLISKSFYTKREYEKVGISCLSIMLIIFSLVLTAVYMVTLYFSTTDYFPNVSSDFFYGFSVLLMSLVLIAALAFCIHTYTSKVGKFRSLEEIIKSYLMQYLAYINNYFEGYLEWIYIPKGQYIEINILNTLDNEENYNNDLKNELTERKGLINEEDEDIIESSDNKNENNRNNSENSFSENENEDHLRDLQNLQKDNFRNVTDIDKSIQNQLQHASSTFKDKPRHIKSISHNFQISNRKFKI